MHEQLFLEHIKSIFHLLDVHAATASPSLSSIVVGDQVLLAVVEKIHFLMVSFSQVSCQIILHTVEVTDTFF